MCKARGSTCASRLNPKPASSPKYPPTPCCNSSPSATAGVPCSMRAMPAWGPRWQSRSRLTSPAICWPTSPSPWPRRARTRPAPFGWHRHPTACAHTATLCRVRQPCSCLRWSRATRMKCRCSTPPELSGKLPRSSCALAWCCGPSRRSTGTAPSTRWTT